MLAVASASSRKFIDFICCNRFFNRDSTSNRTNELARNIITSFAVSGAGIMVGAEFPGTIPFIASIIASESLSILILSYLKVEGFDQNKIVITTIIAGTRDATIAAGAGYAVVRGYFLASRAMFTNVFDPKNGMGRIFIESINKGFLIGTIGSFYKTIKTACTTSQTAAESLSRKKVSHANAPFQQKILTVAKEAMSTAGYSIIIGAAIGGTFQALNEFTGNPTVSLTALVAISMISIKLFFMCR